MQIKTLQNILVESSGKCKISKSFCRTQIWGLNNPIFSRAFIYHVLCSVQFSLADLSEISTLREELPKYFIEVFDASLLAQ